MEQMGTARERPATGKEQPGRRERTPRTRQQQKTRASGNPSLAGKGETSRRPALTLDLGPPETQATAEGRVHVRPADYTEGA